MPAQTGDKVDWAVESENQVYLSDWLSHEQNMLMPLLRICILINFSVHLALEGGKAGTLLLKAAQYSWRAALSDDSLQC